MRTALAILLTCAALIVTLIAGVYLSFFSSRTIVLVALVGALILFIVPKLWQTWRLWMRNLMAGVALTAVVLIGLELLLALTGSPMISRADADALVVEGFHCNEPQGCHIVAEQIALYDMGTTPTSTDPGARNLLVNPQGMFDTDSLTADALPDDTYRILVSGDSFTVGFTAEIGRSYIETLESTVPETTVWNVAFPGTGAAHILASLRYYSAIMQPDLLIAAINQNDLNNNLYPIDQLAFVYPPDTLTPRWVDRYNLDPSKNFEPYLVGDLAVRYRYFDIDGVPLTDLNRFLLNTRTGSRLHAALSRFASERPIFRYAGYAETGLNVMTARLSQLRALADELDIPLLAIAIPVEEALDGATGDSYAEMLSALTDAGIPYLDSLPLLTHEDYRNANPSDPHWNTTGHEKVGAMLSECIAFMIENGGELCPAAVPPA